LSMPLFIFLIEVIPHAKTNIHSGILQNIPSVENIKFRQQPVMQLTSYHI
jgi:hypothetical protein